MQARTADRPHISIIIPAKDEAGAIESVLREVSLLPIAMEVIVVDDGSSDGTAEAALGAGVAGVRVLRHSATAGKSRAIRTGALAAKADLIVTMDGDGQNDPAFIAALIAPFADPAVALVAGQRERRHDGVRKKLQSRLANRLRRAILADDTRDTACGLKAMRRAPYLALPFFDNNHRFFPALFKREGHSLAHVAVVDRPRTAGRSKYGFWDRASVGLPDLLGVYWLCRRCAVTPAVTVADGAEAAVHHPRKTPEAETLA